MYVEVGVGVCHPCSVLPAGLCPRMVVLLVGGAGEKDVDVFDALLFGMFDVEE